MNRVPVIVGGAAKNARLSVIIGGVEKQVHDAYVIVGGVAKRFYQRAITWNTSGLHSDGFEFSDNASYGHLSGNQDNGTAFSEPIFINSIETSTSESSGASVGGIAIASSGTRIILADNDITAISAYISQIESSFSWSYDSQHDPSYSAHISFLIHSRDYGDFYLDSSGTTG